jgi:hypothetical protein
MAKAKSIRWTLENAGSEFGCDSKTLASRIKRAGITAGKDGMFSTRDIAAAVFGDIESEKLRETRHRANLLEIEEQEKRRESIPAAQVLELWSATVIALKQAVWNFDAPEDVRRKWLGELRDLSVADYFTTKKQVEE